MLEAPDSQATKFLLGMPRWNTGILATLLMQCLWSNVASVSACCWGAWCMRNAQPTSSRNSTPKLMSSYVDSQQINITTHSLLCKALLFSKHNVKHQSVAKSGYQCRHIMHRQHTGATMHSAAAAASEGLNAPQCRRHQLEQSPRHCSLYRARAPVTLQQERDCWLAEHR